MQHDRAIEIYDGNGAAALASGEEVFIMLVLTETVWVEGIRHDYDKLVRYEKEVSLSELHERL